MNSDLLQKSVLIPIEKYIILKIYKLENGSKIILPDKIDKQEIGVAFFEAIQVGDKCEKVKTGDFCITVPNAKSLGKFSIFEENFLMVNESDVGVIIRKKD